MDLNKARAVLENSVTEPRAHLVLALDTALRALDRVEAHAGTIPADATQDWRPSGDAA